MHIINKLVRDKIIDQIQKDHLVPVYHVLEADELLPELNQKLKEEVQEYLESGSIEELVDIGEVIHAILAIKNVTVEEYQKLRIEKKEKNGAFDKRIFLEKIIDQ